jgi:hypothetical protein
MEIKRTDALRYTITEQNSKQSEFTEDVANFRRTEEKAKAKQQDQFPQDIIDTIRDSGGNPFDGTGFSGSGLPDLLRGHSHDTPPTTSNTPENNGEPKKKIPTPEINDKQRLFEKLGESNQRAFNALPKISSEVNNQQAEFTEDVANFKEIQKQAESDAFHRAAQGAINDVLGNSTPNIGDRIAEAKKQSTKVSTSENYTKQKLFTELMANNKDSLDKK